MTPDLEDGRPPVPLFESFFLGGFECSCHVAADGRRLDLTRATRHDDLAIADYLRLREMGITAARDGISWVKAARGSTFDFSFTEPLVEAAQKSGVEVIWDLLHFGWPDPIDVFSPSFPDRFAEYAAAFARWYGGRTDDRPFVAPVNEISFLAWAGGDVRVMNPFAAARGVELKVQLVRATMQAIDAIRAETPRARFLQPEPIIQIHRRLDQPKTWARVESDNLLQYQTWDMLLGRVWPVLEGRDDRLDVLGVNFYPDNQFFLDGETVPRGHPRYRSLSSLLLEVHRRYQRPMIISETGSEGTSRAEWLRYVCDEVATALSEGCELHAITLYPVLNHPGWADDRHCENGLWDYADSNGHRAIHSPLAEELARQAPRLAEARARMLRERARLDQG